MLKNLFYITKIVAILK